MEDAGHDQSRSAAVTDKTQQTEGSQGWGQERSSKTVKLQPVTLTGGVIR